MANVDRALEQKVVRHLRQLEAPPTGILLALSGGMDSMVLAEILHRWRRAFGFELAVAHVHHCGGGRVQVQFRRRAQKLVREWAAEKQIRFFTNPADLTRILKGEQELRDFRLAHLKKWQKESGLEALAFAHHQDDLLETRLIRLIRGSGRQGLRAMSPASANILRPLLVLRRSEIEAYARHRELKWVEDPSNLDAEPLRNWLRRKWLPQLEKKREGALAALGRSLEILLPPSAQSLPTPELVEFVGLRREHLRKAGREQREEWVAAYLKSLGLRGYGRTHVQEILKRLDTEQKTAEFELLGLKWKITPDLMWASRV